MIVRELSVLEADADIVDDLGKEASLEYPDFDYVIQKRFWTELIKDGKGVALGLFDGKELEGILIGFYIFSPDNQEMIATESHWYVRKNKRGKGIYLLRAFESWAKQKECKRIYFGGPKSFEEFYLRLGYKIKTIIYQKEI